MVKHNNMVPNVHWRKDELRYIKTHFNEKAKKSKRIRRRQQAAAGKAPRPDRKLRPIVQCPTIKYNMKIRAGRGFSLHELKEAGLDPHYARTIGIRVDPRRLNRSQEGLDRNVKRLKEYLANLVLFPRKLKPWDARNKEKMVNYMMAVKKAKAKVHKYANWVREPMPVKNVKKIVELVNPEEVPDYDAWGTYRNEHKLEKNYFRWRSHQIWLNKKIKAEEERKKKKAQRK